MVKGLAGCTAVDENAWQTKINEENVDGDSGTRAAVGLVLLIETLGNITHTRGSMMEGICVFREAVMRSERVA